MGGIAVVVTLVYLAIQIRQHTSALRTASRRQIAETHHAYLDGLAANVDTPGGRAWWRELG